MVSDTERIRAFLDHDKWAESQTEEERVRNEMRRKILGSPEDTYALNRSEADR